MKLTFASPAPGGTCTAPDSTGETIDFMLSPKRDVVAAKHFLQMALWRAGHIRPRVINGLRP